MEHMNLKLNSYLVICLILFSMFPVQADAPISYNKELASDVELRGTFFTNDNADGFYVSLVGENSIQIDSDIHYIDKTIKIKKTALDSRFKKFNEINIGITHISDDGIVNNYISPIVIDGEFVFITVDFSTIILNGMTGTTTTKLNGLSGNQSISVPNGSSYEFNITNNQVGAWESSDGKSYQNKSVITINGSMVTTESGIPLHLFTNLAGVNGSGDIGIAYTNLTAIPRDVEYVWDADNVSIYFTFNTVSGLDSDFLVLWSAENNTELATDSTYGSEAVWCGFDLVYHMAQEPNGDGTILDYTSNGNDGSASGWTATGLVDTLYGKGIQSGADTELVAVPNDMINGSYSLLVKYYKTNSDNENPWYYAYNSGYPEIQFKSSSTAITYICYSGGYQWNTAGSGTPNSGYNIVSQTYAVDDINGILNGVIDLTDNTGTISELGTSNVHNIFGLGSGNAANLNGIIEEVRFASSKHSDNYEITTHKNLINPTATGTNPFYLSIGETQTAQGAINITATITGDSNTQNYNTSQSKAFTLTPTGTTNNVLVNTTCIDYNVTVTTYWTDDTTEYSQTAALGIAEVNINYTASNNITTAIFNYTFNLGIINFSSQDYIDTPNSTINGSSISASRSGQDVNATAYNLSAGIEYLINITVNYNNIPSVDIISDISAFLGVPYAFSAPTFNDPEGLAIASELWKFGDGYTSNISDPSHSYTTVCDFNANYSVTETATVSPQTILREFNVSVEVQPVQNLTSTTAINNILFDWDNYSSADYWNVSQLDVTIPFTPAYPILDGIKDACYECCCAYGFVGDSPNPYTDYGKELIYILRNSTFLILYADGEDNDAFNNDDEFIIGIDASNNNLTTDDRKFILKEGGTVTAKKWTGSAWNPIATNAQGVVVGSGTPGAIQYEMFIPVSELDTNFTNGSIVKFFMSRTHTASNPDIESYYPQTLINTTDATLWESVLLSSEAQYTYIDNTTISEYNATGLDPYTWYQHSFTSINGTQESSSIDSSDITQQILLYSVSGYILDISGNPIAGAFVYAENGFVGEGDTSDVYGFYEGSRFKLQNYTITANKSGYVDNFITVNVTGNLTNQNITLTAFEMTDWMLWEKLLEIEDAIESIGETEQDLQSSAIPIDVFISLVIISFIFMVYSFLYTDMNNYTHIISSVLAALINFIIAFNAYIGVTKLVAAGNYINEVVYQSSAIASVFIILGLVMLLLTVAKTFDVIDYMGSELKW